MFYFFYFYFLYVYVWWQIGERLILPATFPDGMHLPTLAHIWHARACFLVLPSWMSGGGSGVWMWYWSPGWASAVAKWEEATWAQADSHLMQNEYLIFQHKGSKWVPFLLPFDFETSLNLKTVDRWHCLTTAELTLHVYQQASTILQTFESLWYICRLKK